MKITFTPEQINYLVNELQAYALRRKIEKASLTIGGIVEMINALPKPELKTPWYKRLLWR